jgi:hypothetical protein
MEKVKITAQRVADMTVEELQGLIAEVVDRRLSHSQQPETPKETRSVQEILAAMDSLRWTPPPGSPTTLEMLREDRDS